MGGLVETSRETAQNDDGSRFCRGTPAIDLLDAFLQIGCVFALVVQNDRVLDGYLFRLASEKRP